LLLLLLRGQGYGLENSGTVVRPPAEAVQPDRLCGPPWLLFNGKRELMRWGYSGRRREAHDSPPSSVEVKNKYSYTFSHPTFLYGTGGQ